MGDNKPQQQDQQPHSTGNVVDRRTGLDRRLLLDHSGFERRRGPGRRLSDFTKSAEEGEMTTEQFLFLMAIDGFKKANNKMFPTWTDVLEVIRLLGYRKTVKSEITMSNAEDWTEAPDTPSGVRPDRWHERAPKTEQELTDEALDEFDRQFPEAA